jgi:hypothetical protein
MKWSQPGAATARVFDHQLDMTSVIDAPFQDLGSLRAPAGGETAKIQAGAGHGPEIRC